jgi:hypothetical protein
LLKSVGQIGDRLALAVCQLPAALVFAAPSSVPSDVYTPIDP